MRKTFLQILVMGMFLAGCGGVAVPASTATPMSTPSREPTMTPPALIREINLETQTGTAYTLAWGADGETLAVASGGEITLVSADLNETLTIFRPHAGALGVTWNPDMTQFAIVNGFRNKTITVWDLDTVGAELNLVREIRVDADQYGVAWSPDGKMLATLAGDSRSVIQLWDASTWNEIRTFDLSYTKPRRALQWSADSSKIYSAGESDAQMVVFALDVTAGSVQELGKYPAAEAEVFAVSPDEDWIAISDPHGVTQVFDAVSGQVLTGMKSVTQPVDMAWNPNGETLAILGYKTTLQLWDVSR